MQYAREGAVDLLLGFYGVLYKKRFFYLPAPSGASTPTTSSSTSTNKRVVYDAVFNLDARQEYREHCSWVDDIWLSGHLEHRGVPRHTIGNVDSSRSGITRLNDVGALSMDQGESVKQNHDNVLCA